QVAGRGDLHDGRAARAAADRQERGLRDRVHLHVGDGDRVGPEQAGELGVDAVEVDRAAAAGALVAGVDGEDGGGGRVADEQDAVGAERQGGRRLDVRGALGEAVVGGR